MDFYNLHRDFKRVKQETVTRFVVKKEVEMKNHVTKRVENMLKGVMQMEERN